jgi:aldehyde dehydrogenase (NAD+)
VKCQFPSLRSKHDHAHHPQIRIAHPHCLFIGGAWIDPSKGGRIEVIAVVAEATEADMDKAVGTVRRAFDDGPWPRLSPDERAV